MNSMKKWSEQGFAHLEALLLIVVLVAIGGVAYYVVEQGGKTESQLQTTAQPEPATNLYERRKDAPGRDDWYEYTNSDAMVTFQYPKAWGDVKATVHRGGKTTEDIKGTAAEFYFSKEKTVRIGGTSKDYEYLGPGKDGEVCREVMYSSHPNARPDVDNFQVDENKQRYFLDTRDPEAKSFYLVLIDEPDRYLNEGYEYYAEGVGDMDSCPGRYYRGAAFFEDKSTPGQLTGLAVSWYPDEGLPDPSAEQFEQFAVKRKTNIPVADYDMIKDVVRSFKVSEGE